MVENQKQLLRSLVGAAVILTCTTVVELWHPGLVRQGLPLLWLWFALVAVILAVVLRISSAVRMNFAELVLVSLCVGGILAAVAGLEIGIIGFLISFVTALFFIL
ncbi:MAG: hypothetical protein WC052_05495 [Patescibacteria group bacterium]